MPDENDKEQPEAIDVSPSQNVDDIFRAQSEIQPLRDEDEDEAEDSEGGGDGNLTLEERMANSRKLTDFQTLSNILNPDFGYPHLTLVTKGRTFPDIYNPYSEILLLDLLETTNMSFAECLAYVNTALSISIDGEGRIDNIQAYVKGGIKEGNTEQNKTLGG